MRNYDFKKAKLFIEQNKEKIQSASLGMYEDWFWTAETIFEEGEFTQDLDKIETIGGISGSIWATPVLEVEYKDGTTKMYHCHDNGEQEGMSVLNRAMLGVSPINEDVQAEIENIELEEI